MYMYVLMYVLYVCMYCIAGKFGGGKFGKFGESSMICQIKTIQISTYN